MTNPSIMRVVLMTKWWIVRQFDVKNAFLTRDLQDDVYMVQLEGFIDKSKPYFVYKLKIALYGLKQAL